LVFVSLLPATFFSYFHLISSHIPLPTSSPIACFVLGGVVLSFAWVEVKGISGSHLRHLSISDNPTLSSPRRDSFHVYI
jgi:hypothetical protein